MFAGEGRVKTTVEAQPLERINDIFHRMKQGDINGRIVLDMNMR